MSKNTAVKSASKPYNVKLWIQDCIGRHFDNMSIICKRRRVDKADADNMPPVPVAWWSRWVTLEDGTRFGQGQFVRNRFDKDLHVYILKLYRSYIELLCAWSNILKAKLCQEWQQQCTTRCSSTSEIFSQSRLWVDQGGKMIVDDDNKGDE